MKVFNKIKSNWGNLYLRRIVKKNKRKAEMMSFSNVSSIGILYIVDNDVNDASVQKFVNNLQQMGKKVSALGIVLEKSSNNEYNINPSFNNVFQEDLNWFGKPISNNADNFMNSDFDIMIDVTDGLNYTAKYLFFLTKSKLKVANFEHCDLSISREKTDNLDTYFNNIQHYLTLLKTQ